MRWKAAVVAALFYCAGFLPAIAVAVGEIPPSPVVAPISASLANLDFEQGEVGQEPAGWIVPQPVREKGYRAMTVADQPESGARCAVLSAPEKPPGPGDFGNLMRSVDATAYRGKRIRFRAAVRAEGKDGAPGRAQLWVRVDRSGGAMGFFDNMGDRPITSATWGRYEIVGDVAPDAQGVSLGMILLAGSRAWIDSASLEVLGEAGLGNEPARPLTPRGLDNLVAFTRLLGYVRYFHPSDAAAATDWNRFALAGVQAVEKAAGPEDLARTLTSLFLPIAPTVRVDPSGRPQPIPAELLAPPAAAAGTTVRVVAWRHVGVSLGMDSAQGQVYRSERIDDQAPKKGPDGETLPPVVLPQPGQPLRVDLGGGVSALVPLALYAGAKGTLPAASVGGDAVPPRAPDKPAGFLPSGDDRATRLADVALAWNVFQHFYPYFDVVQADWPGELRRGLTRAAADRDAAAFEDTLARLVAALHDGHGHANLSGGQSRHLPILWDWVENRLVVTAVDREHAGGLQPGDVITAIEGRPAEAALLAEEERISGATAQWRRYRSLQKLASGGAGSVRLTVEHPGGAKAEVTLERSLPAYGPGALEEKRPEKIAEVAPGIVYVDIGRISDDDWKGALDRLAKAKGIVFDFRGYPSLSPIFLQNLTSQPIESAQWRIPVITRPDHEGWTFAPSHWTLEPLAPRLTARIAFVTDGRAISYAESCMGIVEHYKLGAIVGAPTAGTNGNINPFTLPGGYHVTWTGMQVLKNDGSRHHGVGILPTVPVSRTIPGVAAEKDEMLQRAIEVVSK
jgi:C-terminal processing protease CtpA/Prc